jgi:hypothetical protein
MGIGLPATSKPSPIFMGEGWVRVFFFFAAATVSPKQKKTLTPALSRESGRGGWRAREI